MADHEETFVPHIGWLTHEVGDDVGRYLREGWFEYLEQALWWRYLRPGDTVVDCGAHVGLFTLLASQAVGEYGKVIALEPNPATASLLRKNVAMAGVGNVEVVEAAAASESGSIRLHAGSGAASAYSSSVANVASASDVDVRAATIDDLLRERGIESVAMLKIDVEGAELDAWKGCAPSANPGRIALAMVEFTEANQAAAGLTSQDLVRAWSEDGYAFHRFDGARRMLVTADLNGPVEYENLFAARDGAEVNRRLREASLLRKRIAEDVMMRGAAAHALLKRGCDVEHYQGLVNDLQARLADVQRRLEVSLRERGTFEQQLVETQHRAHTYAAYIDRMLNSRTGRVARRLHLANLPGWIDMLRNDLAAFEAAAKASITPAPANERGSTQ